MATKKRTIKRATHESDDNVIENDPPLTGRPKALVFISHDSRDADLAELFANLLTDVSAGTLKSFRSSDKKGNSGIEFGTEWYTAIMAQLDGATDVVALFTADSVDRPWILYEAGVAKGKLDRTVFGVALGIPLEKVATGPFGQFQNCGDDEDSLTKVVMQLLQRNPDASPREEAVRTQVKLFRSGLEAIIKARGKPKTPPATTDEQNIAKLFEEVKAMVRELPDRVDDRVRAAAEPRSMRRTRRLHPAIVEEFAFHPRFRKSQNGPAISWLLIISMLRDDLPWAYEAGMVVYQALRGGKQAEIRQAAEQFSEIIKMVTHSPGMHEFLRPYDDEAFFILRELPEILHRVISVSRHLPRSSKGMGGIPDDEPGAT